MGIICDKNGMTKFHCKYCGCAMFVWEDATDPNIDGVICLTCGYVYDGYSESRANV